MQEWTYLAGRPRLVACFVQETIHGENCARLSGVLKQAVPEVALIKAVDLI